MRLFCEVDRDYTCLQAHRSGRAWVRGSMQKRRPSIRSVFLAEAVRSLCIPRHSSIPATESVQIEREAPFHVRETWRVNPQGMHRKHPDLLVEHAEPLSMSTVWQCRRSLYDMLWALYTFRHTLPHTTPKEKKSDKEMIRRSRYSVSLLKILYHQYEHKIRVSREESLQSRGRPEPQQQNKGALNVLRTRRAG